MKFRKIRALTITLTITFMFINSLTVSAESLIRTQVKYDNENSKACVEYIGKESKKTGFLPIFSDTYIQVLLSSVEMPFSIHIRNDSDKDLDISNLKVRLPWNLHGQDMYFQSNNVILENHKGTIKAGEKITIKGVINSKLNEKMSIKKNNNIANHINSRLKYTNLSKTSFVVEINGDEVLRNKCNIGNIENFQFNNKFGFFANSIVYNVKNIPSKIGNIIRALILVPLLGKNLNF